MDMKTWREREREREKERERNGAIDGGVSMAAWKLHRNQPPP